MAELKMARTLISWFVLLLLNSLSCGPGVAEGALPIKESEQEASDSDNNTETNSETESSTVDDTTDDSDLTVCVDELASTCQDLDVQDIPLIVEAEYFGEGVSFVGLASNLILAQKTVGQLVEPMLIALDFSNAEFDIAQNGLAVLNETPSTSIVPLGVTNCYSQSLSYNSIVLARRGTEIVLFGADMRYGMTVNLIALPNATLSFPGELRGIVYLANKVLNAGESDEAELEKLCAFGDGIICYDGQSWETLVEPNNGDRIFNDIGMVEIDGQWAVVGVGDGGRIAAVTNQGVEELDVETDRDWRTITAGSRRFAIAGEGGMIVHGTWKTHVACMPTNETIVSWNWLYDGRITGITISGVVFTGHLYREDDWLCVTGIKIPQPLDTKLDGCEAAQAFFVLTKTACYGDRSECPIPV